MGADRKKQASSLADIQSRLAENYMPKPEDIMELATEMYELIDKDLKGEFSGFKRAILGGYAMTRLELKEGQPCEVISPHAFIRFQDVAERHYLEGVSILANYRAKHGNGISESEQLLDKLLSDSDKNKKGNSMPFSYESFVTDEITTIKNVTAPDKINNPRKTIEAIQFFKKYFELQSQIVGTYIGVDRSIHDFDSAQELLKKAVYTCLEQLQTVIKESDLSSSGADYPECSKIVDLTNDIYYQANLLIQYRNAAQTPNALKAQKALTDKLELYQAEINKISKMPRLASLAASMTKFVSTVLNVCRMKGVAQSLKSTADLWEKNAARAKKLNKVVDVVKQVKSGKRK